MNGQTTQTKRNGIPSVSQHPNFKYAKTSSNMRVNYTSNDIRIIEEYANENQNELSIKNDHLTHEVKASIKEPKSNKKNIAITFACESEDFISLGKTRNNHNSSSNLKANDRNNSSSLNFDKSLKQSQARDHHKFNQRNISPNLKDTRLQSLYHDKKDFSEDLKGNLPTYYLDSNNNIIHDNTYCNMNMNSNRSSVFTNKLNQVYDFSNSISGNIHKINSSGIRLYRNHKKNQLKLQSKRHQIEYEFKANMTPTITEKAKNISRNPDLFGERLYPYHKVNMIDGLNRSKSCKVFQLEPVVSESKTVDDLYGHHSYMNIYIKQPSNKSFVDYNFTPALNKRSLMIASDMESSSVRLTKKKGKKETNDEKILNRSMSKLFSDSNSLSLYGNLLNIETSINLSIGSSRSLARSRALYERALTNIENKKTLYEDKKKKEEEEYKRYSYKPQLVSKQINFSSAVKYSKKDNDVSTIYTRQADWKRSLLQRQHSNFLKHESESATLHTFKPIINKSFSSLDKEFMKRMNNHMEHSVCYVRNRRKNIDERDPLKVNSTKSRGESYAPKATIPQEFKFSQSNSTREYLIKDKVNQLSHLRKELNTERFFEFNDTIKGVSVEHFNNLSKQEVQPHAQSKKKDNTSYLKLFLEQNITPKFTKEYKVDDTNPNPSLDTFKIHSVESEEESFYFLNGSKNKFHKLDVTFESKDVVLKALEDINEKYMNFN